MVHQQHSKEREQTLATGKNLFESPISKEVYIVYDFINTRFWNDKTVKMENRSVVSGIRDRGQGVAMQGCRREVGFVWKEQHEGGTLLVIELSSVLTVMVDTWTYVIKLYTTTYIEMHAHTITSKTGEMLIRSMDCINVNTLVVIYYSIVQWHHWRKLGKGYKWSLCVIF